MPFRSQAQRRFLFSKHPDIAKRWASEFPNQKRLPERIHSKYKQALAIERAVHKKMGIKNGKHK